MSELPISYGEWSGRHLPHRAQIFGLTVRAGNVFSNFGAQLRQVVGGEVGACMWLLVQSRNVARQRLSDATREVGGNAVVAMRFECSDIGGNMTEVAAYGTAVTIEAIERSADAG